MKVNFYSPFAFERWNWANPDTTGIGGSEQAQVELTWRMARLGHDVTSYAPIPKGTEGIHQGVMWRPFETMDFNEPALWIISRAPQLSLEFTNLENQKLWLICQDVDYPNIDETTGMIKDEHLERFDKIFSLCTTHHNFLKTKYKRLADKIILSSNGINVQIIEEIETLNIKRDPHKLVYTSSPDRGLLPLLKVLKRAQEYIPTLSLDICYGWDNIDKYLDKTPDSKRFKAEIVKLIDNTVNVRFLGRLPRRELYKMMFSAGIYVYITSFQETGYITGYELQACGLYPIVSPLWAANDYVQYGIGIEGEPEDPITICRFANALASVAKDHKLIEPQRPLMMKYSRKQFDWQNIANQYDKFIKEEYE